MAYEMISKEVVKFSPGPFDVHMHPRVTDGITPDAFVEINGGVEGKAGLKEYTLSALKSGIVGGGVMPNEIMRRSAPWLSGEEQTVTEPWPISNHDRVLAMQSAIQQHSRMPLAVYAGIDPLELFEDKERTKIDYDVADHRFKEMSDDVVALKLWADKSTGGFEVNPEFVPNLVEIWTDYNPNKPVILHAEGNNIGAILTAIDENDTFRRSKIHIAHVSSRTELQAVIDAKEAGMNVTCEVTVHHLFLNESARGQIGGYGCMKPSLKPQDDVDFLWANMQYIDVFASDCAPHRKSDKESEHPAFGVTNHTVMLPLLLGAVDHDRLTLEDIDEKFCKNPRKIFNLPENDGSHVTIDMCQSINDGLQDYMKYGTSIDGRHPQYYEDAIKPKYGHNPFTKVEFNAPLIGKIIAVKAGQSHIENMNGIGNGKDKLSIAVPSYSHIITPKTIRG